MIKFQQEVTFSEKKKLLGKTYRIPKDVEVTLVYDKAKGVITYESGYVYLDLSHLNDSDRAEVIAKLEKL